MGKFNTLLHSSMDVKTSLCSPVFLLIAISIVFYSLNNRYLRMVEEFVLDKWTGKTINVFEQQR